MGAQSDLLDRSSKKDNVLCLHQMSLTLMKLTTQQKVRSFSLGTAEEYNDPTLLWFAYIASSIEKMVA